MDDADEAHTISWRLRRIRETRGKPLRVIAELAGMSTSTLHRIENRQRAVTPLGDPGASQCAGA